MLKLVYFKIREEGREWLGQSAVSIVTLAVLVLLLLFSDRVQETLSAQSREQMGSDLMLSVRRFWTEDEKKQIQNKLAPYRTVEGVEFYTLAQSKIQTRLMEIAAVGAGYPLISGSLPPAGALVGKNEVWISPECALQMQLVVGDSMRLGAASFRVAKIVEEQGAGMLQGLSLAPRVWMGLDALERTGLVRAGSTQTRRVWVQADSYDLETLKQALEKALPDPGVQVVTHAQAAERSAQFIGVFLDYLGLVALAGLWMALLSGFFRVQARFQSRCEELALLRVLGLSSEKGIGIFVLEQGLLGFLQLVGALVSAGFVFPRVWNVVQPEASITAYFHLPLPVVIQVACVWLLGVLCSVFPSAVRFYHSRLQSLLQEGLKAAPLVLWSLIPVLLLMVGVGRVLSHSWKNTAIFLVAVFGSSGVLIVCGAMFLFAVSNLFSKLWGWPGRLAYRSIVRGKGQAALVLGCLGVSVFLLQWIPILKESIRGELTLDTQSPSLFLFDLQEEQVEPFKKWTQEKNLSWVGLSPLIRARLESVNGAAFERVREGDEQEALRSREEEQETRLRNRGMNLSVREKLSSNEAIIAGPPWEEHRGVEGQPAPISVEVRYAKQMKLKLGDLLHFDIQGVGVDAVVASLRKVRWTSFQPGFFVLFPPGVIDEAPKSFLVALTQLDAEGRARVQRELVQQFPNVSAVDVTRVVERLHTLIGPMFQALEGLAVFVLLIGFWVLFTLFQEWQRERRSELQLLSLIGASQVQVRTRLFLEFQSLYGVAVVFGSLLSLGGSYLMGAWILDGMTWQVPWTLFMAQFLGFLVLGVFFYGLGKK